MAEIVNFQRPTEGDFTVQISSTELQVLTGLLGSMVAFPDENSYDTNELYDKFSTALEDNGFSQYRFTVRTEVGSETVPLVVKEV
jgi:hypothetical protein